MKNLIKDQTCGTCLFCERIPRAIRQGRCRNGPPTVIVIPAKGPLGMTGIQQMAFYPPVSLSDQGCGEYELSIDLKEGNGED